MILAVVILVAVGVSAILLLQPPPAKGHLSVEPLYEGLAFPVSFAFTPDGRLLFNELKEGNVRVIEGGELQEAAFLTLEVAQPAEAGLLGLALDPDYETTPYVYVYYTYEAEGQLFNRISRFNDLGNIAGHEEVLMDGIPANTHHNSGRLTFGPDGMLYASVGDALDSERAQNLSSLNGKILRMSPDGSVPADNPFSSYVYIWGIRNVFGMDFVADGTLVFTDNGPSGNDEVNDGSPGSNYGWPRVTGRQGDDRFVDPILLFNPSIAPTGVAYYTGDALGSAYKDRTFFGSWNHGALRTIVEGTEGFGSEVEIVLGSNGILDVVNGPDGSLYISTPEAIHKVVLVVDEGPQTAAPSLMAPQKSLIGSPSTSSGHQWPARLSEGRAGGLGWSRAPG